MIFSDKPDWFHTPFSHYHRHLCFHMCKIEVQVNEGFRGCRQPKIWSLKCKAGIQGETWKRTRKQGKVLQKWDPPTGDASGFDSASHHVDPPWPGPGSWPLLPKTPERKQNVVPQSSARISQDQKHQIKREAEPSHPGYFLKLKNSWLTILHQYLLYSKMTQSYNHFCYMTKWHIPFLIL